LITARACPAQSLFSELTHIQFPLFGATANNTDAALILSGISAFPVQQILLEILFDKVSEFL
jgi:hypothetical protein